MAKFKFKKGGAFLLDEESPYYAVLDHIEEFTNPKNTSQKGVKFHFEIISDIDLIEGEGTSRGKLINTLFWASAYDEDEGLIFPESGKFRAACESLAEFKGMDIDDLEDWDDLIGGVVLLMIVNNKDKDKDRSYSNIESIKAISEKKLDKVKALLKEHKASKDQDIDDEPKAKSKKEEPNSKEKSKKKVEEDDKDDFEEDKKPKKSPSNKKDDDDDDDEFFDD
jgi:hypothetical protein